MQRESDGVTMIWCKQCGRLCRHVCPSCKAEIGESSIHATALLNSIHAEWHDVRTAQPGIDYNDGWNAALLRVAEIVKESNKWNTGKNDAQD